MATKQLSWTKPLLLDEGIRAVICMLPMIVGMLMGKMSIISILGQGGFYYSYLPLPQKIGMRFLFTSLLIALGLGYYLMGGNVVFNPLLAVIFTFFVGFNLVFLSTWKLLGPLAFSFISIYAAGLNAGSPEKVHDAFFAFIFAMGWAALISMLPIWKGTPAPKVKTPKIVDQVETAIRMGFGTSIALGISYLLDYTKLGWAPSGVGNVVRFDGKTSKKRARFRMFGTIVGVIVLIITFSISIDPKFLAIMTLVFAFLNGLTKATKLGQTVTFYTVTILILYTLNDIPTASDVAIQRILYNLVGILIGIFVVVYSFPNLFKKLESSLASKRTE